MTMFSFWQRVAETPWWVFLVFIYFINLGWQATKPRIVSTHQLFFLLIVLVFLSSSIFVEASQSNFYHALIWFAAIVPGLFLGWMHFSIRQVKAIKNENKLLFPGTFSLLLIVLTVFAAQYYYNLQFLMDPNYYRSHALALMTFYGFFTGIFLGRLIYAINCLQKGPFVN